jgi:hypothetical protein
MRPASRILVYSLLTGALLFLLPLAAFSGTAASHSKYAGTYESEVPEADQSKNIPTMSVSLGTDGTATLTQDPSGKGVTATTLFGHWVDSGNQVTIRFDATGGKPAPAPVVLQPSHDGLQAVSWDHSAWGKLTPPLMKKGGDWHSGHHRLHIF